VGAAVAVAIVVAAACSDDGATGGDRGAGPTTTSEGTTTSTTPPVANTASGAPISFTEVAEVAGIGHVHHEVNAPADCLFAEPEDTGTLGCVEERVAGGVAAGDFDADGLTDLYFTRLDGPGVLYRNAGNGTFTDVTATTGLDVLDVPGNGAAWADLENDGYPDLYVTTLDAPRFYLFMNDGSGRFEEAAVERGAAVADEYSRGGFSVAVGDYDRDGWVDLHTTAWELPRLLEGPAAPHARLLHNRGEDRPGYFVDVTEEARVTLDRPLEEDTSGLSFVPSFSFGSTLADLDGDGWQDLAVVSDFGSSQLFWNNRDGTFENGTDDAGVGLEGNGMGSTLGDYDADGDLDWFVTAIMAPSSGCGAETCDESQTGNRLYRNDGDRRFSDVTDSAGVRDGRWGWGASFADLDNDGSADIVMTNGQVFSGPGYGSADPSGVEATYFATSEPRLWRSRRDGTFEDIAAASGLVGIGAGKGLAVLDFDRDGDLDVVMANNGGRAALYRNDGGNAAHWLGVDVQGSVSNRDGVGAIVTVTTEDGYRQRHEIGTGSVMLGQSERIAHFGIGIEGRAITEVRVEWPGTGKSEVLTDVAPDQVVTVTEPN
jgi:hypothetical protein